MSFRFRVIQLKRNKFAKITIGSFIILLLLFALHNRSENILNSREPILPRNSRFSNQVRTKIIFLITLFNIFKFKGT